jgi:AbrB family looped-hinge helix DNA binding protein
MPRFKAVTQLPYKVRVYINNQVLIPAKLVRALRIAGARYTDVVIKYGGDIIELRGVRLLRTRHTASRQFMIPKDVREKYGIKPGDEVEILDIKVGNNCQT